MTKDANPTFQELIAMFIQPSFRCCDIRGAAYSASKITTNVDDLLRSIGSSKNYLKDMNEAKIIRNLALIEICSQSLLQGSGVSKLEVIDAAEDILIKHYEDGISEK